MVRDRRVWMGGLCVVGLLAFIGLGLFGVTSRFERFVLIFPPCHLIANALACRSMAVDGDRKKARRTAMAYGLFYLVVAVVAWVTANRFGARIGGVYGVGEQVYFYLFWLTVVGVPLSRRVLLINNRKGVNAFVLTALIGLTTVLVLLGAWFHTMRITFEPANYLGRDVTQETVTFTTADGVTLTGLFYKPKNPIGTVLVCHGVRGGKERINGVEGTLTAFQMAVFTFDFRGHGDSGGHTFTYGAKEVLDVRAALDYLLSRPDVQSNRIAAFGMSAGAAALVMAQAETPEICGYVLDSLYSDFRTEARFVVRALPEWLFQGLYPVIRLAVWWDVGVDPDQLRPIDQPLSRPVMLMHGTADGIIPIAQGRACAKRYGVKLWEVAGAPHCQSLWFSPAVEEAMLTHLQHCLKGE